MKKYLPTVTACALITGMGVIHGLDSDRWGMAANIQEAADRLTGVPETIGEWTSTETPIPERQVLGAEALSTLSRRYINQTTGETVNVMILSGRPGPISVHPPTVCFTGTGYVLEADQVAMSPKLNDENLGQYWVANFTKTRTGMIERMRTYWTWSDNGNWIAADNPRVDFHRSPVLFKMYLTRDQSVADEDPDAVFSRFLADFLPVLNESLFDEIETET